MKGIMGAKKKPLDVKDAPSLNLDTAQLGVTGSKTRVLSAHSPEPRKAGLTVEDDGTGAQKIVEFLASQKLV
jgi:electron transfer flavoprotein beta subunit